MVPVGVGRVFQHTLLNIESLDASIQGNKSLQHKFCPTHDMMGHEGCSSDFMQPDDMRKNEDSVGILINL